MSSVFRPALLLMGGRSIGFAVTFLIPVVLVRMFDQADFGAYKQVFLVASTLLVVAPFGMAESLYYFVPSRPGEAGRFALNTVMFLGLMGTLCWATLALGAPMVARALGNPGLASLLPLLGGYLAMQLTASALEITLIAENRHRVAATSFAVSEVARAALFLVPAMITGKLEWLLVGGIAFSFARVVGAIWVLRREFPGQLRPDWALFRTQIAYALPFQAAVVLDTVYVSFHQYAVSHRFDVATFAIYAVGCLQAPVAEFLAAPTSNVMMVRMAEEMKAGRPATAWAVWDDTTIKLSWIFIPLAGLFIVGGRDLILLLFTSKYAASVPIFMVWAVGNAFNAFQTDSLLRVCADMKTYMWTNAVRVAFVLGLTGFAMSRFGLLGPVLVTVGALGLGKMLALARVCRKHRATGFTHALNWKHVGWSIFTTVVVSVISLSIRRMITVPPLLGLLITGAVYASFFGGLLLFSYLRKSRGLGDWAQSPES